MRKGKGEENENTHSMGCGGTRRGRAAVGVGARPGEKEDELSSVYARNVRRWESRKKSEEELEGSPSSKEARGATVGTDATTRLRL